MRIYLIHNKKGDITETADAGYSFEFSEEELKFNHPGENIIEISEEDYQKIQDDLFLWQIKNGKIEQKSLIEIKEIKKQREEWRKNYTIQGLKNRIQNLESKII